MTTKTITIKSTDLILDIINKRDGVPLGWINSMLTKLQGRIPASEMDSVLVHGLEGVSFTARHTLTQAEEQAQQIAEMQAMLVAVRQALPREGEPLTEAQLAKIRDALIVRVHA